MQNTVFLYSMFSLKVISKDNNTFSIKNEKCECVIILYFNIFLLMYEL